ncbi:O-antigen translocase [Pseudomonas sp.]|uniref:O-antigen translocase n=1 Tax=Pseudomonas sp. TaxID=306 RepID=UPI003FD6CA6F
MTLIRTSALNALAVATRMLTLLGLNKILAFYVGPTGYAALGQFQNAVQMLTSLASGSINVGVTKFTAEYHKDESYQQRVWMTAGTIALVGSLVTVFVILGMKGHLATWFLKDETYSSIFVWFSAALVFLSFNSLLLAILNGKKDIYRYVVANITGSVFSLVITTILVVKWGLYGALVGLAVYQSLSFFITLVLCYYTSWFKFRYLLGRLDWDITKKLMSYAAMAITSAICLPVSQILIRSILGDNLGWESAGYWEAMSRLSAAYLMFVTATLSVYYLPRLSELKSFSEIKHEIVQGYKLILPVTIIGSVLIYLLRDTLIITLFTKDFLPMRDLFAWQMIGDTLKIGSWILAYVMLSQAMFKVYIVSEIFFSIGFVCLTWILTKAYGLQGVVIAHSINYLIYWFFMSFFVYRELSAKKNK